MLPCLVDFIATEVAPSGILTWLWTCDPTCFPDTRQPGERTVRPVNGARTDRPSKQTRSSYRSVGGKGLQNGTAHRTAERHNIAWLDDIT